MYKAVHLYEILLQPYHNIRIGNLSSFIFRDRTLLQGSLITGLESRVTQIEDKLSDLDARGSEEFDNAANERDLHRFILSGMFVFLSPSIMHV